MKVTKPSKVLPVIFEGEEEMKIYRALKIHLLNNDMTFKQWIKDLIRDAVCKKPARTSTIAKP